VEDKLETDNFNPFDEINQKYSGRLMEITESFDTRYKYTIWYDYTRELYNKIKEGSFLAVKNFQMPKDDKNDYYSILKIVKKMPTHYASVERLAKGYPAFSEESIKGVRDSFTDQIYDSFEDLTKIVVNAVPTFFQVCIGDDSNSIDNIKIEPDESIPILGEITKILHKDLIEKIINGSYKLEDDYIVEIADFKDNEEIKIFLDIESALKTHFGIFGFTGVGKTNLLSTFISKIFTKDNPKKKVLFFDIMDEYLGLLIDLFFKEDLNAYLVFLNFKDLSYGIKEYFKSENLSEELIERFYGQMILPKALKDPVLKPKFMECIKNLFIDKKIKFYHKRNRIIDWIEDIFSKFLPTIDIRPKDVFHNSIIDYFVDLLKGKFNIFKDSMTKDMKFVLVTKFKERISKGNLTKAPKNKAPEKIPQKKITDAFDKSVSIKTQNPKKEFYFHNNFTRPTWKAQLSNFIREMDRKGVLEVSEYEKFLIDEKEIIDKVHSKDSNSLFIFISSKEQNVREFLNNIGRVIYNKRKNEGLIDPLTTMIFDEADTFIPQGVDEDSVKKSKVIIEQIARRGRKFGIGIGLATQRITFLETNILAQLHTYFISRLPRKSDRDRIKEAFSLSDEEFEATLKFVKGNWLLVSHEGLGLEGVPLSIKAEDANKRIRDFLENI